jgi:hypothetical protein
MTLDSKMLSTALLAGGLAVLAGAVAWWFNFYSWFLDGFGELNKLREAFEHLGPWKLPGGKAQLTVLDTLSCLYSSSDVCGLAMALARLGGKSPYEPAVFWVGLAAVIAGLLIRVAAKPSRTE